MKDINTSAIFAIIWYQEKLFNGVFGESERSSTMFT